MIKSITAVAMPIINTEGFTSTPWKKGAMTDAVNITCPTLVRILANLTRCLEFTIDKL
ncbi:MAG: hypothetical protein HZB81_01440 [Deltaproteobacteria bacterium]|nr:hypothetical protein [Deltaproteobacteria bacterium]